MPEQFAQRRDRSVILSFKEQPVRGVPPPPVRIFERRDERGRLRLAEPRRTWILETGRRDAVNAAPIASIGQVEMLHHVERDVDRLDDLTAHVEYVECPVGRIDK